MPSFREITDLRKSGDLEGARTAALEALQSSPHDRFIQGAYGWVLYEDLKRNVEAYANEKVSFGKIIQALNHIADEYRRLENLKRPDLLHSLLLQQFMKVSNEWPSLIPFLRWWGLGNFRQEDRQPFQPKDGDRAVASLEMRVLHAVAKSLTKGHLEREDAEWAASILESSLQTYPDDVWFNYYKAKTLLTNNQGQEALQFLQPVVMRNLTASWVWDLLGQIIEPDNSDKAIICYFRTINLAGQPMSIINTRARLARLLARAERFDEAAHQVRKARDDRTKAGFRINQELLELLDAAWFKRQENVDAVKEPNVEGAALEVLCELFPDRFERKTGVLENHNKEKELAYVIFSAQEGMPLPYRFHKGIKKLSPGTLVDVSLTAGDGRPRVVSVEVSRQLELPGFMRHASGDLEIIPGKSFGFVHLPEGGKVFVSPGLLAPSEVQSGTQVKGIIVRSIDKKSGKEGWKMVTIAAQIN